ncbi:uncharacterized protein BDV14DRAFT_184530 [Aspergillus stella-maris]|uniref:uncharacterized protein n=1 Tax=Aspergillus stella-maris TaxID=1810926 RepID=UPI003CCD814C
MVFGRPRDPNPEPQYALPLKTAESTAEILLSDLPTKSVTLAPGQATIVWEIHTSIQPGQTDIAILGLDPHVNRDSIRVEGSGDATITDIQSSIVPNRASFEDVFPSESESDSEDEALSDEDEEGLQDPILQDLQIEIEAVNEKLSKSKSEINSSLAILDILNTYGRGLSSDETKDVQKLQQFLAVYTARREKEGERHRVAERDVAAKEKELALLKKKFEKRKARYDKERRKASKDIRVQKEKRSRARDVKRKERMQKRFEQRHFWPASVGMVIVSLDTQARSTELTPLSSRRSSITDKPAEEQAKPIEITLLLSYIVPGPSWTPRYDLAINSVSSSAQLTYRAEFKNASTEIWRDTQLTLATSQASFSGIGEKIPSLDTWNIKLVSGFGASKTTAPSWERILDAPRPSSGLFATRPSVVPPISLFGNPVPAPAPAPGAQFQTQRGSSLFGNADVNDPSKRARSADEATGFGANRPTGGGLFGNAASQPQQAQPQSGSPLGSTNTQLNAQAQVTQQSGGLFGSVSSQPQSSGGGLFGNTAPQPPALQSAFGWAAAQNQQSSAQGSTGGLFGSVSSQAQQPQHQQQPPSQGGGLFGSRPPPQPQQSADNVLENNPTQASRPSLFSGGLFGALRNTSNQAQPQPQPEAESEPPSTSIELEDDDAETDNQSQLSTTPSLSHQDTLKQEHGMTTTYNLPGTRTLVPSLVSRRHVLATLDLNTVSLTYVIVPKHREAAFLRARVKNTSSLTLHPGTVGITVDGSFIGSANIEKCAPNIFFNISLGVDPGIEVKYFKPIVKPLSGGMFFNKEDGAKFRRSVWVKNSKSVAVDLVVSDQAPVSEDEKLGVKLLTPRVEEEGDEVPLNIEKGKGEGVATLLKNGEVKWTLRLEAQKEVKLLLEYEARVPNGSDVACVSA